MEIVITIFIIIGVVVGGMLIDTAWEQHQQRKISEALFRKEMDMFIAGSILANRGKNK